MDKLMIVELKELLNRLESEHKGYLKSLNDAGITKASNKQLKQVEAMHLNVMRVHGLIQWLEMNETVEV